MYVQTLCITFLYAKSLLRKQIQFPCKVQVRLDQNKGKLFMTIFSVGLQNHYPLKSDQ